MTANAHSILNIVQKMRQAINSMLSVSGACLDVCDAFLFDCNDSCLDHPDPMACFQACANEHDRCEACCQAGSPPCFEFPEVEEVNI